MRYLILGVSTAIGLVAGWFLLLKQQLGTTQLDSTGGGAGSRSRDTDLVPKAQNVFLDRMETAAIGREDAKALPGKVHGERKLQFPRKWSSRPTVFIGILTAPDEVEKRSSHRSNCALEWRDAENDGLLRWRFFVGEPEGKEFANLFFEKAQGVRVSGSTKEAAEQLLKESMQYNDIEIGAYGDHYITLPRKTFHIFNVGSTLEWSPDFVVKMDIDKCFNYKEFQQGWFNYMQTYRGHELTGPIADKRSSQHASLEFMYRPSKDGPREATSTPSPSDTAKLPLGQTPHLYPFWRKRSPDLDTYKSHTDLSRPVVTLIAMYMWNEPAYPSQVGGYGFFEPYPSGPIYSMSTELAREIMSPANHAYNVLTTETAGHTSEDVNAGYWVSRVADTSRLQIDLVTFSFAHDPKKK